MRDEQPPTPYQRAGYICPDATLDRGGVRTPNPQHTALACRFCGDVASQIAEAVYAVTWPKLRADDLLIGKLRDAGRRLAIAALTLPTTRRPTAYRVAVLRRAAHRWIRADV